MNEPVKPGIRLVLLGMLLNLGVASADDWERHPLLEDRWRISVGGFFQTATSRILVSGTEVPISLPRVDLEEVLGLSKHDARVSGQVHWRFGDKWSLALQYVDRKGSASAELEEDLYWKGATVPAGLTTAGGVSSKSFRVFMGRKLSEGQNHEFGAGLGIHWLKLGAFIEGEFYLSDQYLGLERRNVSAAAPLPNVGAWYAYAWNNRWAANIRVDYFSASFKKYSGQFTNAGAGLVFQAWRNVAFGVEYNFFRLDVDIDSGDWLGSADFTRDGPFAHLTMTW